MKIHDINLEETAEEDAADRKAHEKLAADHQQLLKREDVERVGRVVVRLVDGGIAPAVVAKCMLIGDRRGSKIYELAVLTPALSEAETVSCVALAHAIRDVEPVVAATMLIVGAVWLAEQSGVTRGQLIALIGSDLARRPLRRIGAGALDLVDNDGLGNREWLVDAINKAKLPDHAPLVLEVPR